ncbi:MAG TPA: hypothetical protein VNL69_01725 [Bacteroidota bacterium]|nr:hypothetical protein [Bacteroidota bacterium]
MTVPEVCVWLLTLFNNRIYFGFISKARWRITFQGLRYPLDIGGKSDYY